MQAQVAALTSLNCKLTGTLERQAAAADNLQDVLYSTNLATLLLDPDLNIRFFTPATALLFDITPNDIGRPLSQLSALGRDKEFAADARQVLASQIPSKTEIEAASGVWLTRRILPHRAHGGGVEGVVVTFTDVSDRKRVFNALEEALVAADRANMAKSRFLAVASHDLRQPLQALSLLQGLLGEIVEGRRARGLVTRLAETLDAMSGMLNTLLDVNQIESGVLAVHRRPFPINNILERLKAEFSHQAEAQGLTLRKVRTTLWTDSDPRLLEQMIRNLMTNALKYTRRGKVLLGCRRQGDTVRIEIWDTGLGIASGQLEAIFEEYHQVDNPARERSQGLGLGLSIVKRLGDLLGHPVDVRSRPGHGSVFSIDVPRPTDELVRQLGRQAPVMALPAAKGLTGTILLVEDDPDIRDLLQQLLQSEGHHVVAAIDGPSALQLLRDGALRPDMVLSDFNLPGGLNGLELAAAARDRLKGDVPVGILTGDISAGTLRAIARDGCVHLSKPVRAVDLSRVVADFMVRSAASAVREPKPELGDTPLVYVVDDDADVRAAICSVLEDEGLATSDFGAAEGFLEAYRPGTEACLLVDAYLPGVGGLDLLRNLAATGRQLPTTMITGRGDVAIAVEAMKAGAMEFIEKPIGRIDLLAAVSRALERARAAAASSASHAAAHAHIASLTGRQRQIMDLVLAGHPSKNIAADLGISQRTVENHRASVMRKTGVRSLPALARLAVAAD